jgi:hypothetical protein
MVVGKALRENSTGRSGYKQPVDHDDPASILEAQGKTRLPDLVATKTKKKL